MVYVFNTQFAFNGDLVSVCVGTGNIYNVQREQNNFILINTYRIGL